MTEGVPAGAKGGERRREAGVLLTLAVPAILSQLATMAMGIVDTLMVSRLGTNALAATTLGAIWVFGTLVLPMGVLMGLDAIVTQAHGAGDGERLGVALQRGLVLAVAMAVPLALLWTRTDAVLGRFGQLPELVDLAHRYTVAQIASIPCFLVFTALRQYLSGREILRPVMWLMWLSNGVNVVLNWVLIFGHLGFEPRGVVGAGIASGLSRMFMGLGLVALVAGTRLHRGAWVPWSRRAFAPAGLLEILRLGVPVGVQLGLEVWAFHATSFLAGLLGATALAAHAIVLNLAAFTFMVPLGLSVAAATRVGNRIGAGEAAGARRAAWIAIVAAVAFMAAAAVAFVLLRGQLPRLWSPSPAVLLLAAAVLPVAAAFQVFDGTQVVGCGVLRAIGDTRPAAWFNLLGYYGLGIPVGCWLTFRAGWGLAGLWWGLVIGLAVVALLLVIRIRAQLCSPVFAAIEASPR